MYAPRTLLTALVAASLLGCRATAPSPTEDRRPPREEAIPVVVKNMNWATVEVYAVAYGQSFWLGMVETGRTESLELPARFLTSLDLYLSVDVKEDPRFERRGNDLHTTATVNVFTAILGGEADVETLGGKVKLNIPAGTQPEQVFRLAGRGMPSVKNTNEKGDLYVRLKVQIPKYLSAKQRELLEEASRLKF